MASLAGQLLIAMPGMTDKRFARSVIYMCAHSNDGAMGIILNQHARNLTLLDLLQQLSVVPERSGAELPGALKDTSVHVGGPVSSGRGFVLHSGDYFVEDESLRIDDQVSLTATVDILRSLVAGSGPRRFLLALGYSGWAGGQLEAEIQSNGWLHCDADADLVFDPNIDDKYSRAMSKIGVDVSFLSAAAGRA
ncbi:MAG TPA: YqgE/AlgH family protein [Hyphomicrobiaceae bacterium]|nr:YqgE/AlgH family protein [Hyphomicrobiaceae bacterium]